MPVSSYIYVIMSSCLIDKHFSFLQTLLRQKFSSNSPCGLVVAFRRIPRGMSGSQGVTFYCWEMLPRHFPKQAPTKPPQHVQKPCFPKPRYWSWFLTVVCISVVTGSHFSCEKPFRAPAYFHWVVLIFVWSWRAWSQWGGVWLLPLHGHFYLSQTHSTQLAFFDVITQPLGAYD